METAWTWIIFSAADSAEPMPSNKELIIVFCEAIKTGWAILQSMC